MYSYFIHNLFITFNFLDIANITKGLEGLIVTATGYDDFDFVYRYFAPNAGINEVENNF